MPKDSIVFSAYDSVIFVVVNNGAIESKYCHTKPISVTTIIPMAVSALYFLYSSSINMDIYAPD